MDEKADFAQRLRDAMTEAGYSVRPVVLEREFNARYWGRSVTIQAVRRWLHGEAIPAQDKLLVLAEWLSMEPHVLRYGEAASKALKAKEKRWDEGVGYLERETFGIFLQLPAPQRKIIREIILAFSQAHGDTKA